MPKRSHGHHEPLATYRCTLHERDRVGNKPTSAHNKPNSTELKAVGSRPKVKWTLGGPQITFGGEFDSTCQQNGHLVGCHAYGLHAPRNISRASVGSLTLPNVTMGESSEIVEGGWPHITSAAKTTHVLDGVSNSFRPIRKGAGPRMASTNGSAQSMDVSWADPSYWSAGSQRCMLAQCLRAHGGVSRYHN